jgi:hypothetical protein
MKTSIVPSSADSMPPAPNSSQKIGALGASS